MTEALKDPDSKVRIAALQMLADIGPAAKPAVPNLLEQALHDPIEYVGTTAAGALLIAIGLSAWVQIAVVVHPDAQGALAYFFLPIYLLGLIPIGYAVGRLAGDLLFKQTAPPA